jgi:hypothetical protein
MNVFNMQHAPQFLPLPKGQKRSEKITYNISKDHEIRP